MKFYTYLYYILRGYSILTPKQLLRCQEAGTVAVIQIDKQRYFVKKPVVRFGTTLH